MVSRYPAASIISSYLTFSALAMDLNSGGEGFLADHRTSKHHENQLGHSISFSGAGDADSNDGQ